MSLTKIGSFNVVRLLGRGAAGESYLCEDRHDGRKVVVKLRSGGGGGVLEEARKVGALTHPGIAVCQVGQHEGQPFLATEYLEGLSLDEWLKEKHAPGDQLRIVAGVTDALNYAHEQGVMHRNLKPSNVHVLSDGWCKLMDFGLGPTAGTDDGRATAYVAPEVLQGQPYTQKADTYGAGSLFYETLAGRNPFQRDTPAATAAAVQSVQPPPLGELRKDIKRDLADAIMACLEKDPDWRPKDLTYIQELLKGLDLPRQAPKAGAKPKPAPRPAPAAGPVEPLPSLSRPKASGGGGSLPLILGVVALVAAGGGIWWWMSQSGTTTPPVTAPPRPSMTPPPSTEAPATPETTPAAATPTPRSTPSAAPPPSATPAAAAVATPVPESRPTLAPVPATQEPHPTPAATLAPPTTVPPLEAPPSTTAAAPAEAEPAVLKNVTPPSVRRKGTALLDVHGSGLRADHRVVVLRGKDPATGITVVRQRLVSPALLQVALQVDEGAAPGSYTLALTDNDGRTTNPLRFEVAK